MKTIRSGDSLRNYVLLMLGVAGAFCGCVAAHAATFCATSSAQLQADLTTAAGNNQSNTIRVYVGTYLTPPGGFVYNTNTNHSLDLEGGWYSLGSGTCDFQAFTGNFSKLDGQVTDAVISLHTGTTTGNVTVRYFTFQNGLGNPPSLDVITFNSTGAIRVENSLFRNNRVGSASHDKDVVQVASYVGVIYFLDNAIIDNVGVTTGGTLFLFSNDTADPYAVYMNNNTIAGNTAADASPLYGLRPLGQGTFTVSNNIVWNGGPADVLNGSAMPPMIFSHNDVDHFQTPPASSVGDINTDPRFRSPANGNYQIWGNSPARNAGDNSPPGTTRNYDLNGQDRVVFGTVDMGAYELQDEIFPNGFGG
jgi:hypothetical protein